MGWSTPCSTSTRVCPLFQLPVSRNGHTGCCGLGSMRSTMTDKTASSPSGRDLNGRLGRGFPRQRPEPGRTHGGAGGLGIRAPRPRPKATLCPIIRRGVAHPSQGSRARGVRRRRRPLEPPSNMTMLRPKDGSLRQAHAARDHGTEDVVREILYNSCMTSSDSLVRPSYMVMTAPRTPISGRRRSFTSFTVQRSWPTPSRGHNIRPGPESGPRPLLRCR